MLHAHVIDSLLWAKEHANGRANRWILDEIKSEVGIKYCFLDIFYLNMSFILLQMQLSCQVEMILLFLTLVLMLKDASCLYLDFTDS